MIGSQTSTPQTVAAEIVAQHIEHRLKQKVERRFGLGTELIVYQELTGHQLSLYPTTTGAIETEILKEQPSPDPSVVLLRARSEMARVPKLDLLDLLGYDNGPVMVVRANDAQAAKLSTLSQAAAGDTKWKIGTSYEFQQRRDGADFLNTYKLPLAQVMRGMEAAELFPALDNEQVSMIAADAGDGHLASPAYKILTDDGHAFPAYQACLLVRQDVLAAEPQLRGVLSELSGKFTTEGMRKMSAQVDVNHRSAADVAAEFLEKAGLK